MRAMRAMKSVLRKTPLALGMLSLVLALSLGLTRGVAFAAEDGDYVVPKTSWGEPDLQGMWPLNHLIGVPMQRNVERYGDRFEMTEEEYAALNSIYTMAKLPEQAKMINDLRKEKFPNGMWQADDLANNAMRERDIEKKKQLVAELTGKIESGDPTTVPERIT